MMRPEKIYSFQFLNLKAFRYLLLIVVGLPVTFWILFRYPETPLSILLMITLIPAGSGAALLFVKIKRQERVRLDDSFFDSDCYGRVSFSNISSIVSSWKLVQPNIIIKLRNGRKIRYAAISNESGNKNSLALQGFAEDLSEALSNVQEVQPQETMETNFAPGRPGGRLLKRYLPYFLFAGIAVLLFLNYGRFVRNKTDQAVSGLQQAEQTNRVIKQQAELFIKDFQKKHGPYYLFTNDPEATVQYLPEVFFYDFGDDQTDLLAEADSLNVMMAHPLATDWYISLLSAGGYTVRLNKQTPDDSSEVFLYLAVIDTLESDSVPVPYLTAIPANEPIEVKDSLSKEFSENKDLKRLLLTLKAHPATAHFYVAARGNKGRLNEVLFKKRMNELAGVCRQAGISMPGFVIKEIE